MIKDTTLGVADAIEIAIQLGEQLPITIICDRRPTENDLFHPEDKDVELQEGQGWICSSDITVFTLEKKTDKSAKWYKWTKKEVEEIVRLGEKDWATFCYEDLMGGR